MNVDFTHEPLDRISSTVLAVYGFEGRAATGGTVERLPGETRALLEELHASGELSGKSYECTLIHRPPGLAVSKLLVVGAGKQEKFNNAQLRRLAGTAVRHVRARSLHDLAWLLDDKGMDTEAVQAVSSRLPSSTTSPLRTSQGAPPTVASTPVRPLCDVWSW